LHVHGHAGELLAALRAFGLEDDRLDSVLARGIGASPMEFRAMDHLQAQGELTPGDLGERLHLSSGAVTALVDRLVRLGWVERVPHPRDRRSVLVRPAKPASESLAMPIYMALAKDLERAASETLSAEERAACARFLEAAAKIAATHAQRAADQLGVRRG
jgi:DNA-binding MarR family transcriptional regulator